MAARLSRLAARGQVFRAHSSGNPPAGYGASLRHRTDTAIFGSLWHRASKNRRRWKGMPKRVMTVREAGKKGGTTTKLKYGSDFFRELGRKGGTTTRRRHGRKFYQTIGKKGGDRAKRLFGHAFYRQIGRKGSKKARQLMEAGRAAERK